MNEAVWRQELTRLAAAAGRDITLASSLPSTHQAALEVLAGTGAPSRSGSWIVAYEQTAGVGRLGRSWASPPGRGVYASWVAAVPRAMVGTLPLALGIALCDALEAAGFACRLKWPNDLLLGGDKVGGLLLHARGRGPESAVVASFGLNHGHRRSELPRPDATSLALQTDSPLPSLAELTSSVLSRVESSFAEPLEIAEVLECYRERSSHQPGDELEVRVDGGPARRGRFLGFSATGQLRLDTADGELAFSAGEVTS